MANRKSIASIIQADRAAKAAGAKTNQKDLLNQMVSAYESPSAQAGGETARSAKSSTYTAADVIKMDRAAKKAGIKIEEQTVVDLLADSYKSKFEKEANGNKITTGGGYYSRPQTTNAGEKLYGSITTAEPVLKEKRSAVTKAQTSLKRAENDMRTVQGYLEQAKTTYDADPTEANQDNYNQVVNAYQLSYDTYTSAHQTYADAYESYRSLEDALSRMAAVCQGVANQQQSNYDDWRGTIRDADTVKREIDTIDVQISKLKKSDAISGINAFMGNLAMNMAASTSGLPVTDLQFGTNNSAQIQQLEKQKELLQEELDWSRYYYYADFTGASDFTEKSKYVTTANGLKPVLNKLSGKYTETGFDDLTYDYINKNQEAHNKSMVNSIGDNTALLGLDKSYLEKMTDEEISIFNYLYATRGADAAYQYTAYLTGDLTRRQRMEQEEKWAAWAKEDPVGSSAFSVMISPIKGLSYLGQTADYFADGEIDHNAAYNKFSYIPSAIRETVPENWGPVGTFAYQTGMSMADFLFTTGISGGNSTLAMTIMGSGAAADATLAAKDRGLEDWQAFTLGSVAGIAEAVTEKWSIETLLNPKLLKDGTLKYMVKNMLVEGGEEAGSDLINLFFDFLIAGDQRELKQSAARYETGGMTKQEASKAAFLDWLLTFGLDILGGALSGGILSGGGAVISHVNTKKIGSELGKMQLSDEEVQAFIETGLESDHDTESYQLATEMQAKIKAGKTLSNYDLSRLYQANVQVQPEARWDGATEPEKISLKTLDDETDGEVSASTLLTQAKADLKAGKITDAEFDAIIDEVMHLEEQEEGTSVKSFDSQAGIDAQTNDNNVDLNGGINYDHNQQPGRTETAQPAGEFDIQRTDVPDGIQIRDASQSAGIQTGQVASGPRRQGSQTNSQAKTIIERQNTARDLRQRGLSSNTSSLMLGIESGTDTENLFVMPQEYYDAELQQAAQLTKAETGLNVAFVVGDIEINRGSKARKARGAHTGRQIVVQCDDTKATAMQIVNHEVFHDKAMREPGLTQRLKEEIQDRFSAQEFDAVMGRYIDELWPLYAPADETAWEEYEGALNAILEEMLADAYAGINAFEAHAERFTETVRELTPSNTVGKQQNQDNGTKEPTGPPSDRYSYAGENANNADLDALARAKEMQEAGVADETIRRQTGWHTGMDGKWRWEIDDSGMRYYRAGDALFSEMHPEYARHQELMQKWLYGELTPQEEQEFRELDEIWGNEHQRLKDRVNRGNAQLQNIIRHDDLFEAYPQLRKTRLRFADLPEGTRGQYDPGRDEITLRESLRHAPENTLVHEIQHAIQKAEGFTGGASVEYWKQQRADIVETIAGARRNLDMWLDDIGYKEAQRESLLAASRREKTMEQHWKDMAEFKANSKYARQIATCEAELAEFQRQYDEITNGMTAYEQYENTAGEIEARDAASRRQLTAEQRRNTEPARADDRTVFMEGIDEETFAELDAEYGPQLQSVAEFDRDTISGNIQQVARMEPVTSISGQEFAKGEVDLITQVETFFNQRGNRAFSPELGEVILDRKGVKSDIAHGIGRKKAAAFAAVPDVLEHGLVVDYQKDWKGRGYDTAVVAAPITIGDQTHAAAVILLRSDQTNRFYVHEVLAMENGALPFKTGTREGYPGGDAPSIFSLLDKIRSVKNGIISKERFSAVDTDASGTNELRKNMTTKEREILRGVETRLLRNIGGALSVTKFGDRNYLKSVIQSLSDTYLESGTIEQQAMDDLFEQAYRQGIIVDRELYDQYEEVRKYLHTVSLTLDPRDRSNIADYPDFVKRMRGRMRIVNEGGLPVDSAWRELNEMAPELFPDSIAHPADQLVQMTKVLDSLRITEKSLGDYYGPMAGTYKKDAKAEFERAVWDSIGELRQIRRFEQERQQKQQEAEPAPTTPEEAMEAWAKLKTARKTYERAIAKNLLTTEDEIAVGELLKGKMLPEHLNKDKHNEKGILAVFEAKQEYEHLVKLLNEYRRKVKADLRAEADTYLETANTWKDKNIGLLYSREIMQRNVEDIVPDKNLAKRINERYFEPVRDAEAAAVKMKEEYREAVRKLNLSRKVQKGNLVSEAHAVQLYGEAMDNIRMLEKARGHLKHRDGKSLEEWRGAVYKLWQENPGLDKSKIENAVAEMRRIYDELFQKMNEVRVRWGYEPVNYRQGYFPHFQPGDGDGIMAQFGRVLGIDTQVVALPTTINGLTHTFKPGIQWFGNAQERLGFNTAYDAVEGFDRYIEGVASVICQTENIQRLRALASQIRYRTSDDGIRKQVDAIYANPTLTEEQKNDAISGIYEKGRYTLSNFVVEIDEYTNLLANKKSKRDRKTESDWGRKSYVLLKWLESRVGANMIAGNVTSALTNFIPLTQAGAQLSKKAMLQGMRDTLVSYKTDDGIISRSSFLTNRRGSDPLVKMWQQDYGLSDFLMGVLPQKITEKKAFQKTMKGAKKAYAPIKSVTAPTMGWIQDHSNVLMELIDSFTAGSIVRAAYHQNLKRGLSESEAMHQADIFASRVMAERSKGGMPTLFAATNPIDKLFTQFQLEVNNQWSEVFKDIPRSQRERGLGVLALVFLQYFLGAWIFNSLYEMLVGRRPAMDPIDIVVDTVRDFTSDDVSTTDALSNLANNVLEELPFSSALTLVGIETDGGRVPVSSGIPNIPTLVTAATNEDWAPEKRWKEAQDELNKLAYVIPPFGGNQASKIWKGIKAYIDGGSYSVDSDGNDILQYPVYNDENADFWGLVQAMLLGKSSLPEAQEWVEDGFDSLSAKQTALYQDMIDSGISEREAYDLIDNLRSANGTDEVSKKEAQIDILRNADATDECKAIAFYGLLATENERLLMDSLTDSGAMPGTVMDVLLRLRDASTLPEVEEKTEQADVLNKSALTENEKEIIIRSWLDDQEVNEKGNLTSLGKFNLAVKQGITTEEYLKFRAMGLDADKLLEYTTAGFEEAGLSLDQFMQAYSMYRQINNEDIKAGMKAVEFSHWVDAQDYTAEQAALVKDEMTYFNMTPASSSRYDELVGSGMDPDDAYDLTGVLNELEPEEGKDEVSDLQKWRASVDFSANVDDQLAALSAVMSDAQFQKVEIANNFGVSPDAYVTLQEIKPRYDADGNGSYKNAEIQAAIDSMIGNYSSEQKAVLWQLATGSTSAKNNPYSRQVGQQVLDARAAVKEQTKATTDNTDDDAFSRAILDQLLG